MAKLLAYTEKNSFVHKLNGITKFLFFIAWSLVGMVTYDTRVLGVMLVMSLVLFKISKTDYTQIALVFKIIILFLIINLITIFLLAPYEGTKIYGSKTILVHLFWNYSLSSEQLFYELNVALKYITIVPVALMFIVTTNPSEFASSLNRLGLSYTISIAVSLALRYIPDVQREFIEIKRSQEAKGLDMSKNAPFFKRVKTMAQIIFPLVFLSMEKITAVSNAMELRGFGKKSKRTWYSAKPLAKVDLIAIILIALFVIASMIVTFYDGSRFFNPFK